MAEIEKQYTPKHPGFHCAGYEDFRVMLEKEKGLDAVLCATPDHLHAYVSTLSMRAGKHVYCEKPLTHNVAEARLVAKVAAETKVATQMGNQLHATDGLRQTVGWLHGGVIGPVREVHAWVGTRRWNPSLSARPTESVPVPSGLNWDLWLGPRERRPFHPSYAPVAWRDFWAFGNGALGDFGCHDMDSAVWALDLDHPTRVEASAAGPMDDEISPHGEMVHYEFPARGDRPALGLHWYDGGLRPRLPEQIPPADFPAGRGALFVGEKGVILSATGRPPRLYTSEGREQPSGGLAARLRSKGHHREWLEAIKGGEPAGSHFGYGARLTEIALLGVAAVRLGKPLIYDAENLAAKGAPEAERILRGSYRKGWELT
jgi:predicted dehydrogenase